MQVQNIQERKYSGKLVQLGLWGCGVVRKRAWAELAAARRLGGHVHLQPVPSSGEGWDWNRSWRGGWNMFQQMRSDSSHDFNEGQNIIRRWGWVSWHGGCLGSCWCITPHIEEALGNSDTHLLMLLTLHKYSRWDGKEAQCLGLFSNLNTYLCWIGRQKQNRVSLNDHSSKWWLSRVEVENMYIPEQTNWAEQQTEQSHYEVELGDLEDSRHG